MKTLFIDFDGTICHDRFWRGLPTAEYEQIQNVLFREEQNRVRDWMRGAYTSEDIVTFIAAETGLPSDRLFNALVHGCTTMHVAADLLAAIDTLRNNFFTVLITGNMDCFSRFTVPALKLDHHFDVIVNSANEAKLKTDNDGETFLKYLQGNITDSILIEDSSTTCTTFTNLGGTALQVTMKTPALQHLQSLLPKNL